MKKFNKYIIPSIVLLGLLVLVFTTIRTLSVLTDITTSDVLVSKAIDTAITFNILKFLVCLGAILYTTNFLGYLYRSDEEKKAKDDKLEQIFNTIMNHYKNNKQPVKKDNTSPRTNVFPTVLTKKRSIFKSNEEYYKYLGEEFTAYLKLVDWTTFHKSAEWEHWIGLFNDCKPLMKDYEDIMDYRDEYGKWYKHLPIIVLEGMVERGMIVVKREEEVVEG